MKHLQTISVAKANTELDGVIVGDLFTQIWFGFFSFIIRFAVGQKTA